MDRQNSIGVIVGRFQAPNLTEGHRFLFRSVLPRHEDVLVVIGCPRSRSSHHDPLDYETRKLMITRAYPGIMAMPLEDCRLDSVWSHNLDELIAKAFPRREAVLYGSRESFLGCYSGKHPTVLVKSAIPTVNATERRRACSEAPLSTEDFRIGAIYAAERRPAVSYQTIDIAVLDHDRKQVLLGARNNEGGLLRFIGGFVDPADQSLELAVKREAHEEAGDISIDAVTYLGSFRIDDWRYRANSDRVLTAFFTAHYIFGVARAHDDIDWVGWVPWDNFIEKLAPEHRPLGQRLTDHIKGLAPKEGI